MERVPGGGMAEHFSEQSNSPHLEKILGPRTSTDAVVNAAAEGELARRARRRKQDSTRAPKPGPPKSPFKTTY